MCEYIVNHRRIFADKTVCELGAGLGMVSILLDKAFDLTNQSNDPILPPKLILATDGDDDTMELLNRNIHSTDARIEAQKLYWGEWDAFLSIYSEPFDILFAADVIYEEEQIVPLVATVAKLLKKPAGIFYLAFARRNVPVDHVIAEMVKKGFRTSIEDQNGMEPIYSFRWDDAS
jgi:predicted nicotinamide N-methyase